MIYVLKLFILLTFQGGMCYPGRASKQEDESNPVATRLSRHTSPLRSLQNVARPFGLIFNEAIKNQAPQDQKIYFDIDGQNDDGIEFSKNIDIHNNGYENIKVIDINRNNKNVGSKDNLKTLLKPLKTLSKIITRPVGHLITPANNKQENQSDKIVFIVNDETNDEKKKYDKCGNEKNNIQENNKITGNNFHKKENMMNDDVKQNIKSKIKDIIEIDFNTIYEDTESTTTESTTELTTEDYETTTLDDLDNRAGVPGPVVASLLG